MQKSILTLVSVTLLLTACGKQSQEETNETFTDAVTTALSEGGTIDMNSFEWTREPAGFEVKGDTIAITTAPHTDLWQRTYYRRRISR